MPGMSGGDMPGMSGGGMPGMAGSAWRGDQGPVSRAYAEANARMHAAMDIEFTGNPDHDFAQGMIAHHKGAIAMAEVLLAHGSDPELKKFAEDVISAQTAEVRFLEDWLAKNAAK
ncbi:DUF305 domain-containing protein [Rhizobiales bacterium L72]|uniref:DUF305 domain-containing protein n=2 Tax=Propylenella binzhouense TaxID=2555902 RepID=A0A964T6B2_9HYPH|nr:DUF305 domain-containing protein [Propylenella binzhouense]